MYCSPSVIFDIRLHIITVMCVYFYHGVWVCVFGDRVTGVTRTCRIRS